MNPRILLPLIGLLTLPFFSAQAKEGKLIPMITDAELASISSVPRSSSMPRDIHDPSFARRTENRFEKLNWMKWRIKNPDYEPLGVVITPDSFFDPLPAPPPPGSVVTHSSGRGRASAESNNGTEEVPVYTAADSLGTMTRRSVLLSERIEKLFIPDWEVSGTLKQLKSKLINTLSKSQIKTIELGDDAIALVATPDSANTPDHDRSRARRFEEEREQWILDHPHYVPVGLIYQPGEPMGDDVGEFSLSGDGVRHAAAALARLTHREVFVQPKIEKLTLKTRKLAGTRQEIIAALKKQLARLDIRTVEFGENTLTLAQETVYELK